MSHTNILKDNLIRVTAPVLFCASFTYMLQYCACSIAVRVQNHTRVMRCVCSILVRFTIDTCFNTYFSNFLIHLGVLKSYFYIIFIAV